MGKAGSELVMRSYSYDSFRENLRAILKNSTVTAQMV